ncbi:MAG: PaREP1 family protein [Thermoproteus sp.]
MAEELGDWVRDVWAQANAMYTNFYEGWATEADVRKAFGEVRDLVERIAERVLGRSNP